MTITSLRIDSSARLIGRLRLGENVYIAQGAVLRSLGDGISLGNDTWVLENSVLIGTLEHPLRVGSKTVFGHKCIAIGAEAGDLCEIGNGVILLPGSHIGDRCILGEGTIIPSGISIPSDSVVVGRPGRVIRKLTADDRSMLARMRGNDLSLSPGMEYIVDRTAQAAQVSHDREEEKDMGKLYEVGGKYPSVADSTFVYDTAEINGDVIIGEECEIGSGVKIIGNSHGPVRIGNRVHILENTVLHLLPDNELVIEDDVIIGPGCIIHGCHIGAKTEIEAGAIVCDYSRLGEGTRVLAGSLIKQRSIFKDYAILEGFPAKE